MNKVLVKDFYHLLWNTKEKTAMPRLLDDQFKFRGSLGQEAIGHEGFWAYVERVHSALGNYHCEIELLLEENHQVFAKMLFSGVHRGELMGFAPSHKKVSWQGCAVFTVKNSLISELWVLGDLKGLERQLLDNS